MGDAGELKVRANAYMLNVSTPAGSGSFPDSHLSAQKKSRPALKYRGIPIADQSSESCGSENEQESDFARDQSPSPHNSAFITNSRYTTPRQERTSAVDHSHDGHEVDSPCLASIREASDDELQPQPLPQPSVDKSKRFVKRHSTSSSSDRRYVSSSFFSRNRPSNLQQQLGSLPNASLQSLLSSLTTSSGSSGNSTVTQKSYDKLSVRRRRPAKRRRAQKDGEPDKRASRPLKTRPEASDATTQPRKNKSISSAKMEEESPIKANMSRPASSASRASRKDSILSPPTPSSRRPSLSGSRSSSRSDSNSQWKRQETFNSDSGISVSSSPEVRIPPKVLENPPVDHDEAASDSSDEASSSDEEDQNETSLRQLLPAFRAPSASEMSGLPLPRALPDPDPLVQRLHEQEIAMQHHILHSPQPKRTIRPQVSSSYHPSPALPLYDRNATSAVPTTLPFSPPAPSIPHGDPMYFQAYYDSHDQHLRAPEHHFQLDTQKTTIAGYEMLAEKLSQFSEKDSSTVKPLYRKFEQLNHRVLLHLQDEIAELEEELRMLDEVAAQMSSLPDDTVHPASRRTEARYGSEVHFQRTQILGKIFLKLQQYNQGLASYSGTRNKYTSAREPEVTAYRTWMTEHLPIEPAEARFLDHENDLVCPAQRPDKETETSTKPTPPPTTSTSASTSTSTSSSDLKHLMTLHCIMTVLLLLAFSIVPGLAAKFLFGGVLICCFGVATWLSQDKTIALRSKKDA